MFRLISLLVLCVSFFSSLAFAETIYFCTVDWPPYYGKDLDNNGFAADVSREAFKRVGYDMSIEFMPWKRAMKWGLEGDRCQGVFGAYKNAEREKNFLFPEEMAMVQVAFMKKKGTDVEFGTWDNIKGKKVGILAGYAYPDELMKDPDIKKDESNEHETSVKKLMLGRIDLIIGSPKVYKYKIKESLPEYVGQLEVLTPVVQQTPLYLMITKSLPNAEKIIEAYNEGMKEIKADGTYDKIIESHGF